MPLSEANHAVSPPLVTVPREYNAAFDLLARHAARGGKPAYVNAATGESITYGELADRAHRFANGLRRLGVAQETRVLLCMHDTLDWPVAFLGSILAGVVPVAVNTLLTPREFEYMLRDSRAQALLVSAALLPSFAGFIGQVDALRHVIVAGGDAGPGQLRFDAFVSTADPAPRVSATCADDPCFWLYSSGSTGAPKGTVHLHSHLIQTAELYGRGVLGLRESDVVFSAAKLFFAYGLGNALTFPLSVGATTVLLPTRPTPADVFSTLTRHRPSVFCGVPTLFAGLLSEPQRPPRGEIAVRVCTSAGEALPAEIGRKWAAEYGCDILDGIGSTEMLHIFLSNRPGEVRYGTTGKPVPGYRLRLVNDEGQTCGVGEIGELQISGPSAALMYWNNREKTKSTFAGEWTRSGDKYVVDAEGYYTYGGRSDDMLKVSGLYVSPFEVEGTLMQHPSVLECAVIGAEDRDGLVKTKAYVVFKAGQAATEEELKLFVKDRLAPHKYPRSIEVIAELPKTATGKIQRFRLRERAAAALR